MSGIEVIRCEIAPKALYFPSKLHKIIISKAYNSAPNLSILTYDVFLERIELIDYHYCQRIVINKDLNLSGCADVKNTIFSV